MFTTRPSFEQPLPMNLGPVSLVASEFVARIMPVHLHHNAVTRRLCDDRSGTDRIDRRVAADDRNPAEASAVKSEIRQPVTVDLHGGRRDSQSDDGTTHGKQRGLENVQNIDLGDIAPGHGPGQRVTADRHGQRLPRRRRQTFRVPQTPDWVIRVQHDGCGYDRSGKRTRDAGDYDAVDVGSATSLQLLEPASEHEWVAAFQSQYGRLADVCGESTDQAAQVARDAEQAFADLSDSEPFYWMSSMLAFCGQKDVALRMLRRAIDKGYCAYTNIDSDARWDSLRDDPEFLAIRDEAIACHQRFVDYI